MRQIRTLKPGHILVYNDSLSCPVFRTLNVVEPTKTWLCLGDVYTVLEPRVDFEGSVYTKIIVGDVVGYAYMSGLFPSLEAVRV